jgi:hypothetical protein
VLDTEEKITVTDWFLDAGRQIEHIEAGEARLAATEVLGLVGALAGYAPGDAPDEVLGMYWG